MGLFVFLNPLHIVQVDLFDLQLQTQIFYFNAQRLFSVFLREKLLRELIFSNPHWPV